MTDEQRNIFWNQWRQAQRKYHLACREVAELEKKMREDKELAESLDDYYS